MKKMPFYIGVLLVIPIGAEVGPNWRTQIPNGYGVGSVVSVDTAILHEAIKADIRQHALLLWIDAQGRKNSHEQVQAIGVLISNIRYVSIENTWYKITRQAGIVSLPGKAIAGAGTIMVSPNVAESATGTQRQGAYPGALPALAAGAELHLPPAAQRKVAVTAFACESALVTSISRQQPIDREMAMIIERYKHC